VNPLAAAPSAAVDPSGARERARQILNNHRYQPAKLPRPFKGPLEWIADRLDGLSPVWDAVARFLASPFGWVIAILVAGSIAAWVATRIASRRGVGPSAATSSAVDDALAGLDAHALERAADDAEKSGDLDLALRLRFRAGLLRLDAAGVIELRPSLTSGQAARRLRLRTFDELAMTFDAVTYGRRAATKPDTDAARTEWPRVVAEASAK
jgi:hypothetical protein